MRVSDSEGAGKDDLVSEIGGVGDEGVERGRCRVGVGKDTAARDAAGGKARAVDSEDEREGRVETDGRRGGGREGLAHHTGVGREVRAVGAYFAPNPDLVGPRKVVGRKVRPRDVD